MDSDQQFPRAIRQDYSRTSLLRSIFQTGFAILIFAGCSIHSGHTAAHRYELDAELIIQSAATNRILTSQEMLRALPRAEAVVNDPVFGRRMHYTGFWLGDVLKLADIYSSGEDLIVFSSLDGYQARLPRLPVPNAKPLLALRDVNQPDGWEFFTHGKERVSPGPFYLVWQTTSGSNQSELKLPWPYQINRIEMREAAESQRRLLPNAAGPKVSQGFTLFTKYCLNCHSINLEGGVLSPELNVPRNITEYRDLIEFIRDPSSFRAKARCQAFKRVCRAKRLMTC